MKKLNETMLKNLSKALNEVATVVNNESRDWHQSLQSLKTGIANLAAEQLRAKAYIVGIYNLTKQNIDTSCLK